MNTMLIPAEEQQIISTGLERAASPHWTNELIGVLKGLPPKYQACIILVGLVGTFGLGAYALHQGGTVTSDENGWSASIKSNAA